MVIVAGLAALLFVLIKRLARRTIVVETTDELTAALVERNAGRRIRVRAGTYCVGFPLTVPDSATLEGEGVMLGDDLPAGFRPGSESRIVALPTLAGDLLTLREGAFVRRLVVEDVAGRSGNAIGIVSLKPGDSVSASIAECEIVNPNPARGGPDGPTGGAVAVLTRNLRLADDPPPHVDAVINLAMKRCIVRTPGDGRALFALNAAARGRITVYLTENVFDGTLDVIGGISRPDKVVDATTTIESRRNLYAPSGPPGVAWTIVGGGSAPLALASAEALSNHVGVDSRDDRIEGVRIGIDASGGRRRTADDGPRSDNSVELDLRRLVLRTGGPEAADFVLVAARSGGEFLPGNRNTLSVDIREATGSGPRANFYDDVIPKNFGDGNRLRFIGTPAHFTESNTGIPTPPAQFFTGAS